MSSPTVRRIDHTLLDRIRSDAEGNPRRRMNYNFHAHEDAVQRFINAIEPGSYIRPHRHLTPPKWELFVCLRGRGAGVIFDDSGQITDIHRLDPGNGSYGLEIPGGLWHTIVSLEPASAFLEIKEGPYVVKGAADFAPWSPEVGHASVAEFVSSLDAAVARRR